MNIEWLHSFVAAAKYKSLSKAAAAQNLSQPAISKHIRNLEQNLDTLLFYRSSSGIELTEAGERFLNRISPVLHEITAIRQELRQYGRTAPIALGCLPSLASYYLPTRIKGRSILGRPLTLMIQNTSAELMQSLQEGRLDAVFIDGAHAEDTLWSSELFTESYYAVFPNDHRFRQRKMVRLAELGREPLIVHEAPCDTRKHIIEQMELVGQKPNIIREVAFGDFILGAVTAGMGITIVPELMAKHINHQQLFTLPISDFGKKRSVVLAAGSSKLGVQLYRLLLGAS